MNVSLSFAWLFHETGIPEMAQNRTGLADVLFGGLIIGATAFFVALPGLYAPAYMGTTAGPGAQVRHQVTAVPAPALEVVGDPDDADGGSAADTGAATFNFKATSVAPHGAHLVSWRRPDGISMARFLERAGRLACPSTAPPRFFA
jgi:hypothetical protein